MKSSKYLFISLACFSVLTVFSHGAAFVSLFIDSGSTRTLRNQANALLTGGSTAVNFDGAVVQVGYYTSATIGNNFGTAGSAFIPLTGESSLFNVRTTVGDSILNGGDNGTLFSDRLDIIAGLNGGANDGLFPAANTPLSIRIFNNTTIASSTFVESVSNNLWLWKTPAAAPNNPIINLFFDSVGLVAKSGAVVAPTSSNIQTNTPTAAPEPTSAALLMVGLVSLASRRRRVAKV